MCIINVPLQAPLHKGMHFVVTQHTEVAMRLSMLWAAVSLAA
jgi:hypothetical protein